MINKHGVNLDGIKAGDFIYIDDSIFEIEASYNYSFAIVGSPGLMLGGWIERHTKKHTPATLSSAAEYIVKPHKQIADVAIAKMMSETTK